VLNVDTQILVSALDGRLRPDEARMLANDFWCISDIVIWELGQLFREARIRRSLDDPELNRVLRTVTVWPITREVSKTIGRLDFRSDPADEIIAATSIVHGVPLVTRDMRILGSKIVPLAVR
jgi:predicted nucleic acid-binding protein